MTLCLFPRCPRVASTRNRTGQRTCVAHQSVVIGTCDDLGDHKRHTDEAEQ